MTLAVISRRESSGVSLYFDRRCSDTRKNEECSVKAMRWKTRSTATFAGISATAATSRVSACFRLRFQLALALRVFVHDQRVRARLTSFVYSTNADPVAASISLARMTRANAVPDSTAGPQASEGGGVRYRLSAVFPFLVLGLIVIASALQTEVAHNLTTNIGYNQPYFTFFVTHITFSFIFPLHLLYLHFTDRATPTTTYLDRIRTTIAVQLNLHAVSSASWKQISRPWCAKIAWLTVLISLPALSWFVAMLYSPAIDITAIYATSAFWAYFFSMLLLSQPLSRVTVGSIGMAFAGVVVLSLDGMGGEGEDAGPTRGRAFGDMIMMIGRPRTALMQLRGALIVQVLSCLDCTKWSTKWCYPRVRVARRVQSRALTASPLTRLFRSTSPIPTTHSTRHHPFPAHPPLCLVKKYLDLNMDLDSRNMHRVILWG